MRPIDADSLPAHFDANYVWVQRYAWDNAPTLDVRPNIHAHWVESEKGYFSCSNCHNDAMVELCENSQKLTLFCPNCGAVMDGKEKT